MPFIISVVRLQLLELGLDLDLLTVPAYYDGDCVADLAFADHGDEIAAAAHFLAVEGDDPVALLESGLLSVLTCDLSDVYAC